MQSLTCAGPFYPCPLSLSGCWGCWRLGARVIGWRAARVNTSGCAWHLLFSARLRLVLSGNRTRQHQSAPCLQKCLTLRITRYACSFSIPTFASNGDVMVHVEQRWQNAADRRRVFGRSWAGLSGARGIVPWYPGPPSRPLGTSTNSKHQHQHQRLW